MKSTICLASGIIFDRRRLKDVVCVFSKKFTWVEVYILCGLECMSVYVCVYAHSHTLHMGYSDVSPGVGTRHLEGSKNPDGQNLGINIFVYVYKVRMCMYKLGGEVRSWTNCFFL